MNKLLFLLLSCTTISYAQECTDFTAGAVMNQNEIQFNALTGINSFNGLNIRTKTGPNGELSIAEYTSLINSMNVWAGCTDINGELKLAAGTYGSGTTTDWSPGPLDENGQGFVLSGNVEVCEIFDRTYDITKNDILEAHAISYDGCQLKSNIDCDAIPDAIKNWPARGNEFLFEGLSDEIKNIDYSDFWDENQNGLYEPCEGDIPYIFIRGCELISENCITDAIANMPDQLSYWIMNDNSKAHELTNAAALQIEVHNYVLMYDSKQDKHGLYYDGQSNQTVQWQYKIINKSTEEYRDFYFSNWFDYDLGCPEDDYAGVAKNRNSVFVYNEDSVDGVFDGNICNAAISFESKIPAFSIDLLRGLSYIDSAGVYTNYGLTSVVFPEIWDDGETPMEYYNIMQGLNKDGSDILDPSGTPTKFMFSGNPADESQWSMCSNGNQNLQYYTTAIMSSGPVSILPNQSNEVRISFSYSDKESVPCPDLTDLYFRNDISQGSYDNCNSKIEGPSAPNFVVDESAGSYDIVFDNDFLTSNNKNQNFKIHNIYGPSEEYYEFEGYKVYQVSSLDFDLTQINNTDLSTLLWQADIQNGAGSLFNYYLGADVIDIMDGTFIQMVGGSDNGVPDRISLTYDYVDQEPIQIGKTYYYVAIAYAKSTWDETFDPEQVSGDKLPYIEGCHNVKVNPVTFTGSTSTEDTFVDMEVSTMINGFAVNNINQNIDLHLYTINGILVDGWNISKGGSLNQSQLESKLKSGIYILNIKSENRKYQVSYKIFVVE